MTRRPSTALLALSVAANAVIVDPRLVAAADEIEGLTRGYLGSEDPVRRGADVVNGLADPVVAADVACGTHASWPVTSVSQGDKRL
ncbi:MAG TPA: hypothetical protein VFB07_03530 [Vicinamibacterales bacterium]|nr:hypothetical protein [Vicinamibacterales bacterium]